MMMRNKFKTKKSNQRSRKLSFLSLLAFALLIIILCWFGTTLVLVQKFHHSHHDLNVNANVNANANINVLQLQHQYQYQTNHHGHAHDDHDNDNDESSQPFVTMYGTHRYEESFHALPKWLQDYFTWHRTQTQTQTRTQTQTKASPQDSSRKYMVISCLPKDTCGGLSDRLRPLPFYLFIAKLANRILCIYWEKPFGLDEFLQPVHNYNHNYNHNMDMDMGIDWICPKDDMKTYYDNTRKSKSQPKVKRIVFNMDQIDTTSNLVDRTQEQIQNIHKLQQERYITLDLVSHSNENINNANMFVQKHSYGMTNTTNTKTTTTNSAAVEDHNRNQNYNQNHNHNQTILMPKLEQWQYPDMIQNIFRVMFEPKPELTQRINSTMTKLGLIEGQFISVHVRTRYPVGFMIKLLNGNRGCDKDGGLQFEGEVKEYLVKVMTNAVQCGYTLNSTLPIFFVSDQNEATKYMISHDIDMDHVHSGGHGHSHGHGHGGQIIRPVGLDRNEEPLHMDGDNNKDTDVTEFFSVFEDLLIMGGSKCVSHGIGSFGSFGAGLSGNRCRAIHRKHNGQPQSCPNNRADRIAIPIEEHDLLFGEKPYQGTEGKIMYVP